MLKKSTSSKSQSGKFSSKGEEEHSLKDTSSEDKRRKALVDQIEFKDLLNLGQFDIDRRETTGLDFNDSFFEEIKKKEVQKDESQFVKKIESEKNIKIKVDEKVYKEGPLIKEGRIRKNWKKRWFILNGPALNYYTSSNQIKGSIPLEACQIKIVDRPDGKRCLMLINNGVIEEVKKPGAKDDDDDEDGAERVLYFDVAEKEKAEEIRSEWLYAINNRIAVLQYSKKMKQKRMLDDIDILEFFLKGKQATELIINREVPIEGILAIKEPIKGHPNLKILNLNNSKIGDQGVTQLCESLLMNNSITSLSLSNSSLTNNSVKELKKFIETTTVLTSLDLSQNSIDNAGLVMLTESLALNKTLRHLDLGSNQIGDESLAGFVDVLLKNTNVQLPKLLLNNNQISDPGCVEIAKLFSKYKLIEADLSNNRIGNDGAEALSNALIENKTLTVMNLEYNEIGYVGATKLAFMLMNNQTLKSLLLGGNRLGEQAILLLGESDMAFPELELQQI